jgi:hypothetical protein
MDRDAALQTLQRLVDGDLVTPSELEGILAAAAADPSLQAEVAALLEQAGATSLPSPPLDIGALYPGGEGPYALEWPLAAPGGLPLPFEQLDRKTQFFVLVNEWSYREMQGWAALNSGAVDLAEATFAECLERAVQLEVGELKARSYGGLQAVEERRGRQDEALKYSAMALAARRA